MAQNTLEQRFKDAVRNFVRAPGDTDFKTTSAARARVFIEEIEPALSRAFLLDYTERVMRAADREALTAARTAAPEPQMRFTAPGFSDLFRSMRQRLPVGTGRKAKRVSLESMTVTQMRQSAIVFKRRAARRAENAARLDHRRAEHLERIAAEMSLYARAHRGLTYGGYLQLRLDGIPAPRKASHAT
jgi:hypothetical protein